ncbi:MAG: tRNA 2-thiouridine(34) synthase MnmA [Desulfobulbaceae bacterium]|jgi:tRNA-specific 2-thiouridylase|nr:tRNA 2-thiouridine(34) synthase MnmA [Desulfobulbaceae bacterium]
MVKKRMAVAMSGGVDSTVTAQLLLDKGVEVHGLFMNLGQPDLPEQLEQITQICQQLGVMFTVVDVQELFQRVVIDYFCRSYFQGRTPNPCVVCNPSVKCGELIRHAMLHGCEGLATGHYVRKVLQDEGWVLGRGVDEKKDQSYFLCGLKQEQIAFLEFPLGETDKETVYAMAEGFGFHGFRGQESQDICFLKNQSVQEFLATHGGQKGTGGQIVDSSGVVLGHHHGIENYTIGQRKGLGISASQPLYVVRLDRQSRQVVVGQPEALFRQRLEVDSMNWLLGTEPELPADFVVKIRHRHGGAPARVEKQDGGYVITFTEPQRAVTPGQFAALYSGEFLLGGGEIV